MNKWLSVALVAVALGMASGCGSEAGDGDARPTVTADPTRSSSPAASFDTEAWRRDTIERFGPEREYSDGTKLDYVRVARALCEKEDRPDYEDGSLQRHILDTFCPNV